ncbi:MAG: hypothetical protein ACREA0_34350, partial [bacterium]
LGFSDPLLAPERRLGRLPDTPRSSLRVHAELDLLPMDETHGPADDVYAARTIAGTGGYVVGTLGNEVLVRRNNVPTRGNDVSVRGNNVPA